MNFYIKSLIFTLVVSASVFINYADCNTEVVDGGDKQTIQRFQVAHFNFEHVAGVYTITLWILLGCLAKIGIKSIKIHNFCLVYRLITLEILRFSLLTQNYKTFS